MASLRSPLLYFSFDYLICSGTSVHVLGPLKEIVSDPYEYFPYRMFAYFLIDKDFEIMETKTS